MVGAAAAGLAVRYFGDNDPAAFGVRARSTAVSLPVLLLYTKRVFFKNLFEGFKGFLVILDLFLHAVIEFTRFASPVRTTPLRS